MINAKLPWSTSWLVEQALLPLVQPMVDLQCRSRAIHNKFRQLKGLLALTKLKSAEFRRDVETATQEVKAHIDKA